MKHRFTVTEKESEVQFRHVSQDLLTHNPRQGVNYWGGAGYPTMLVWAGRIYDFLGVLEGIVGYHPARMQRYQVGYTSGWNGAEVSAGFPDPPGPNPISRTLRGNPRPRAFHEYSLGQGRGTFRRRRRRDRWALRGRRERWRAGSPSPSNEEDGRGHRRDHDHGRDRRDEGPVQGEPCDDGPKLAARDCIRGGAARQIPGPSGECPEDRGWDGRQIHGMSREHVDDILRSGGHRVGGRIRRVGHRPSGTHIDRQRILDLIDE